MEESSNNPTENNNSWGQKLAELNSTVLNDIARNNKTKNKILNRVSSSCKSIIKVKEKNEAMLLDLLGLVEEKGEVTFIGSSSKAVAKELYLVEAHREAMSNRLQHLVEKTLNESMEFYDVNRLELNEILRETTRCVLAERKALDKYKKCIMRPLNPVGNTTLGFTARQSTRDWEIGMRKANWLEALKQAESVVQKLGDKLRDIEIKQSEEIREFLKHCIEIQMVHHAKSLELLTSAFKSINKDEDEQEACDEQDWQITKKELEVKNLEESLKSFREQGMYLSGEPVTQKKISNTSVTNDKEMDIHRFWSDDGAKDTGVIGDSEESNKVENNSEKELIESDENSGIQGQSKDDVHDTNESNQKSESLNKNEINFINEEDDTFFFDEDGENFEEEEGLSNHSVQLESKKTLC